MSPLTIKRIVLPGLGLVIVLVLWTVISQTVAHDLPSPARTWVESRRYVLEPFFKDGEMNQGIGRLAFYSLVRVAKGYALALAIGTHRLPPRAVAAVPPVVRPDHPVSCVRSLRWRGSRSGW